MPEYTPQEAAVLADAKLRAVQKAITEKRIPVRKKGGRRLVDEIGVYTIAVSASLPVQWKVPTRSIEQLLRHAVSQWVGARQKAHKYRQLLAARAGEFKEGPISIDANGAWTFDAGKVVSPVRERMALYEKAKDELIERNPEILGGTPVIKGTRLNVYAIAARLEGGDSVEELLAEYPYVTREQLEAACLYAKANPLRGRPGGRPWLKKKTRSS